MKEGWNLKNANIMKSGKQENVENNLKTFSK